LHIKIISRPPKSFTPEIICQFFDPQLDIKYQAQPPEIAPRLKDHPEPPLITIYDGRLAFQFYMPRFTYYEPAEARHLLVGYSADIEVVIEGRDGVTRIPTSALMPGNRVLVLPASGALEERRIETGLANWEYAEVKSGVAPGELVVTSLDREGVKAGVRAVAEARNPAKDAAKRQ
jgi:hypothetical protein